MSLDDSWPRAVWPRSFTARVWMSTELLQTAGFLLPSSSDGIPGLAMTHSRQQRIRESKELFEQMAELIGLPFFDAMPASPGGPFGLRNGREAGEDRVEGLERYKSVLRDGVNGSREFVGLESVVASERKDVGEVTPPGVGRASLDRGDDRLGEDHGDGIGK